ncbi:MAG: MFS transporter [Candidatus Dojkabacteria bacterium]
MNKLKNKKKNIKLLPYIFALNTTWFWLGVWLPFYLTIMDYAGVGFIGSTVFLIGFLLEIPTGAITDIIGKKRALLISFLAYAVGNFVMAYSTEYWHILLSVLILMFWTSFYSGTSDAILYDSLAEQKQEESFNKYKAKAERLGLIFMALASIIGGFLYAEDESLPFLFTGAAGIIGFLLILFFIEEPKIDSYEFTLKNYLKQNFEGFKHLFSRKLGIYTLVAILVIAAFGYIFDTLADPALLVENNFSEQALGIIFSFLPLVGSVGLSIYEKFYVSINKRMQIIIFIFFLTAFLSVIKLQALIIILVIYRSIFQSIYNVHVSDVLNKNFSSKYRATALSSFTMLSKLPYIATSLILGIVIEQYSAGILVLGLSIIFGVIYSFVALRQGRGLVN